MLMFVIAIVIALLVFIIFVLWLQLEHARAEVQDLHRRNQWLFINRNRWRNWSDALSAEVKKQDPSHPLLDWRTFARRMEKDQRDEDLTKEA